MRYLILAGLTFYGTFVSGQTLIPRQGANGCSSCGYQDYYEYVPGSGGPAQKAAIFFLHGAGGDEGFNVILAEGLPLAMEENQILAPYANEFFVFAPHDPDGGEWEASKIDLFIHAMLAKYPEIDQNRIILTGFSKGGKGVFYYLGESYSNILAGAIPIMGGMDPTLNVCHLTPYPVWAISSENDEFFPPFGTSKGSEKLGAGLVLEGMESTCTQPFDYELTVLTSKNHHGWDQIYNLNAGLPIYKWMAQVRKTSPQNYDPVVMLENDKTILSNNSKWLIYGYAKDINDENLTISWNVTNNNGTLAVPSYTQSDYDDAIVLSNLVPGSYTIRLTASDGHGSDSDEMNLEVLDFDTFSGTYVNSFTMKSPAGYNNVLQDDEIIDLHLSPFNDSEQRKTMDIILGLNQSGQQRDVVFGLNQMKEFNSGPTTNGNFSIRKKNPPRNINVYFNFPGDETRLYTLTATTLLPNGENDISTQLRLYLTPDPSVLPIKLLSFQGKIHDTGVQLIWTTTEEQGNSHFELFRGREKDDLVKVGEVPRAEPNKEFNHYSFLDREATAGGVYYYRLESVDYDGHRDISDIIRVALPGRLEVYPNPAVQGRFYINLPKEGNPAFQLVNSKGQPVRYSLNASPSGPGEKEIVIHAPLPGIYLLQAFHEGRYQSFKVVIPD